MVGSKFKERQLDHSGTKWLREAGYKAHRTKSCLLPGLQFKSLLLSHLKDSGTLCIIESDIRDFLEATCEYVAISMV